MTSLNFDDLCFIAENIDEAINILKQNGVNIKQGDITVHINATDDVIHSIDSELNKIYNITEHKEEAEGVVCDLLGMKIFVSNENQSE